MALKAAFQIIFDTVQATVVPKASCQATPLLSVIQDTSGYFSNPANKYIAVPGLCFQPNRVVVVRGKGAIFPDTFNGNPIWEPPGVMMHYWSMCNNNERPPFPVVACAAGSSFAAGEGLLDTCNAKVAGLTAATASAWY